MLALGACVTTTDSRFTKKADPEKAANSYVALGLGYMNNGDLIMARKKIERAIEVHPESAAAHSAMALYWQERGEPSLAGKEFKIAHELDDEHSPTNYQYGRYLLLEENDEDGCGLIEQAANDFNYDARVSAYEDLGLCRKHFGDTSEAIDAFEKAWSLNENSTISMLELTKIFIERKKLRQASRWYKRFEATIRENKVEHSASSLFVGSQLARAKRDRNGLARYGFKLKKRFPKSEEFRRYQNGQ
jgi:type IV pilus assembly protein PilF